MKTKPKIIVITGAESTGKSELTLQLAHYFNAPFVPEYAREYIENLQHEYTFADVEKIARKQMEQLSLLQRSDSRFIFIDTWLIITKVWFDVVFEEVPEWLEKVLQETKIDLFLVCDTDLPWVPDLVRENGGEKRLFLQKKYIEIIRNYNFNYKIVSGKYNVRFTNAKNFVQQLKKI